MSHHLVILKKLYLDRILSGRKTVECRVSRIKRAPFAAVSAGDTLWLKQSGGPVVATASVRRVEFVHPLAESKVIVLRDRYSESLQADQAFFDNHLKAKYATFIQLGRVRRVEPFHIRKSSRHAWLVLQAPPA